MKYGVWDGSNTLLYARASHCCNMYECIRKNRALGMLRGGNFTPKEFDYKEFFTRTTRRGWSGFRQ